jgi:ATP-dependent Clp protease ATP-binding subunit ClpA
MDGKRLARLAAEAAGAPTPGEALRALSGLRRELEEFERRQVAHALADGMSYAAIARELGLSRQAVHRRFRSVAGEELPLLLAPGVRRVLQHAREEAAAVGAETLESQHVLLAVLRAPDDPPAAAALHAAGVTLGRARTQVAGASSRGRLFGRGPAAVDPRAWLAAPARAARERGAHRIEIEDLLAAALDDPAGGAARTLRALGADPAAIRGGLGTARR